MSLDDWDKRQADAFKAKASEREQLAKVPREMLPRACAEGAASVSRPQLATTFTAAEVDAVMALIRKASVSRDLQVLANCRETQNALSKFTRMAQKAEKGKAA